MIHYLSALLGVCAGLLIRSVMDDLFAVTLIAMGCGAGLMTMAVWVGKVMETV